MLPAKCRMSRYLLHNVKVGDRMDISIFGLGYVGCICAACLADNGHNVISIDIDRDKVDMLNRGIPTIIEKGLDKIVDSQFKQGRIKATTDALKGIENSSISIICV